ncbi:MAG: helix-turn-helix domain-containing protein [Actinomycetota bacterium]|nr:helix-turn-helix domain-containing protein [Actinomycetota bacterium]
MTGTEQILSEARRRAGLSQDELAERAGTSRPTLSSYENGRRSPTLQTATRILAAAATNSPQPRHYAPRAHHGQWTIGRRAVTATPPRPGPRARHRQAAGALELV